VEANTALEKGVGDFTVIAYAPVPVYPASSNRRTLVIGAAVIVLVLGWGILLLIELLDLRIRSGREAAAALGIRVLASLQRADRRNLLPGIHGEVAHAEVYRILALKIRRSLSRPGERILIASVIPDAGKSVVAANLASAWGRSDERVLVLDTETRRKVRPWALDALAADGLPSGLSDHLTFRAEGLGEIAHRSILPGVDLVGRGMEEALPEFLGSKRFAELLGEASGAYGLVLIEAPAVRDNADAAIIGGLCNAVILVVRSRSVTPTAVSRALDELGRERVLGIIMTDVEKAFARRDE
ncbi:MAG: hypothetical protein WCL50_06510, partial [Spirochaetota bacterium]